MVKRKSPRIRHPKAATSYVIGSAPRKPVIKNKWKAHYQRLTALSDELTHRQSALAKDALEENPSFSTHMADAATDTYDRDFALGMLSSDQDALYEIQEAIERILNGSYGICELTGKPIEPQRLEVIPWTRFTASAEKQLERAGVVRKARLGPRDTVTRVETTSEAEELSD